MSKTRGGVGFTLVELLIVVAIIGVLSVVGLTAYSGVQQKARDTKRRADIDAMAKAYEVRYNVKTGKYSDILPSDFANGQIPSVPEYSSYSLTADKTAYLICTGLGNNAIRCNTNSATCYCKTPVSNAAAPVSAFEPCANFNNLVRGQSQVCNRGSITESHPPSIIYINCADLPGRIDCGTNTGFCQFLPSTTSTQDPNRYESGTQQMFNYYHSQNDTSLAGRVSLSSKECIYSDQLTVVLK